jgi:hypothetical protein
MINLDAVFKELRKLNLEIPKPQRLPTEEEGDPAEQELGILFHPDYRKFLLEASDVVVPTIEPAIVTAPPGSHHDLVETVK